MSADQRAEGVKRVGVCSILRSLSDPASLVVPLLPVCARRFMCGCLQAMAAFVAEVDKTALRPLQKQGFLCGADCCDNARTQEELQAW